MRHWWMLLALASCDFPLDLPCPNGPLSSADLPCTCVGQVAEDLACGSLTCTEGGLQVSTDPSCTSSKTYTTEDSGTY